MVLFLLLCPLWAVLGQQSQGEWEPFKDVKDQKRQELAGQQAGQPLTNESIMGLVKIGFSDETIISMIQHEPGNYSLRVDDVIALKKAYVSEGVIAAMSSKMAIGLTPAPIAPAAAAPPGATELKREGIGANQDKASAEPSLSQEVKTLSDPGLYALLPNGALRHIAGRPTNFIRTGSLLASELTGGIHARRMNTQIAGERAYVTVGETPTFYYRVAQGAPDQVVPGTLNLILTEMTVKPGRRQFELEAGGLMRRSQGISVRHQGNFDAQEVEPGLYRLRPDLLKPGQYAFFLYLGAEYRPAKGEALRGFIFDFQVE